MKDMMPHFDLFQPDTLDAAIDLRERLGADGWVLAGGQDSLRLAEEPHQAHFRRHRHHRHRRAEGRAGKSMAVSRSAR